MMAVPASAAPLFRHLLCLVFCLGFGASARAADERVVDFVLHTAAGETLTGPWQALGAHWSVRLGGNKPRSIDGTDVLTLRRVKTSLPKRPVGEQVILAGGDVLRGEVIELRGETVRFQPAFATTEMQLPLSNVAILWLASPKGTDHADRLRRRLLADTRRRDCVHLRNGDVLEGILTAFDRKKVLFEIDRKEVTIEFNKVALIACNTELLRPRAVREPYALVVLTDGSRLTLSTAEVDGRSLRGQIAPGLSFQVSLAQIVAFELRQGRAVYLSDLKPSQYESVPYLDITWPYVRDGNVRERDLRLADSTYDKGLGMRAQSRLRYDLAGGYRRFEAVVGLDEHSSRRAGARIQVLVDGKPRDVGLNQEIGRGQATPLSVDVTGAKELTLVVDFSKRLGIVPGDVNWAEARLIK